MSDALDDEDIWCVAQVIDVGKRKTTVSNPWYDLPRLRNVVECNVMANLPGCCQIRRLSEQESVSRIPPYCTIVLLHSDL